MNPADSVKIFEGRHLAAAGKDASSIRLLLDSVWSFYRHEKPEGLVEQDGDMLLFQYGTHDWGAGPLFEFELTRQFVELERDGDDDVYSQFRLTCYYALNEKLSALGRENRWCADVSGLEIFAAWVEAPPVLEAIRDEPRLKTEISWKLV